MPDSQGYQYRPFPEVAEWTAGGAISTSEIDELRPTVDRLEKLSPELCRKAVAVVRDAAAIETGAIEGLYEIERGVTITAATQGAMVSSALSGQSEKARALIAAQLRAYDFVLDFVTKARPIAEAWIRALHTELCAAQTHYKVVTAVGHEDRPLKLGQYKESPNHVVTQSNETHYYASVEATPAEMHRLVGNVSHPNFWNLHPADQAAYAHYALVAVHPFADGNGRMARALASVYTYKSYRVPLLITADQKSAYFRALELADAGDYVPFRRFVLQRTTDSIALLAASVAAAVAGTPADSIAKVRDVFLTRGRFSHVDVDLAGNQLLQRLGEELRKVIDDPQHKTEGVRYQVANHNMARTAPDGYRRPLSGGPPFLRLTAVTAAPAEGSAEIIIGIAVPKDANELDSFVFECGPATGLTEAIPVRNVMPQRSLMADITVVIYAQRLFSAITLAVISAAEHSLRTKGY